MYYRGGKKHFSIKIEIKIKTSKPTQSLHCSKTLNWAMWALGWILLGRWTSGGLLWPRLGSLGVGGLLYWAGTVPGSAW